jgi:hypothetical protein
MALPSVDLQFVETNGLEPQAIPLASKLPRDRTTSETAEIVDELVSLFNKIASLPDLKPCLATNTLFDRLVTLCVKPHSSVVSGQVLENKRIRAVIVRLRQICSKSEGELERHWARRILQSTEELGEAADKVIKSSTLFPVKPVFHILSYHADVSRILQHKIPFANSPISITIATFAVSN